MNIILTFNLRKLKSKVQPKKGFDLRNKARVIVFVAE